MFVTPSPQKIVKPLYKFCNILIPGRAEQKQFAGRAGNFGPVDTSSTNRQHPVVLVKREDNKITSEFISFRDELLNVASSMELFKWFSYFLCSIWTNLVFNTLIQYNVYYC